MRAIPSVSITAFHALEALLLPENDRGNILVTRGKVRNGRHKKGLSASPSPVKRFFVGVWHRVRLILPTPANAVRYVAVNHTLLYRMSGAMIVGVPPVALTSYYQVSQFAAEIRTGWPVVAGMLDHYVVIGCILGGAWVYLVMGARRMLMSFVDVAPPGWDSAPSTILKVIDNVVGAKQQRFCNYLVQLGNKSPPPTTGEIFSAITRPAEQIAELVKGVYSAFDILLQRVLQTNKHTLKVNLALIDSKEMVQAIKYHYPSNLPVRSQPEALNDKHSTIRCAIAARKTIVIESTLAESIKANPRFAVTDPAYSQEDGSLICYPVVLEGIDSVVFVLSIYVDVPAAFKQKHITAFNQVIAPFALRLKLEYALLAMKEGDPS